MPKQKKIKDYRQKFINQGYAIVENVLTIEEAKEGVAILLDKIRPESPESYAGIWGTRRQLKTPEHSIPEIARFATHPKLLEVVSYMIDGSFRLTAEPLPVVTFPGKVCGCLKDGNWRGHTDGLSRVPFLENEGKTACIWLTFADIESSGGATTLIPGSHCLIEKMAVDPEFRATKEKNNTYTAEDNLDGLNWNPKEVTLKAGGVFFFNDQAIHSASDNLLQQPRLICAYGFTQKGNQEEELSARRTIHGRFNSDHLEMMDDQMKQLIGLV
ncbi:TPA: hypothetical protein EYN98_13570 [Candidatus Poribacteria bacterium]|nr:hypothetical protein [Candidatus Poribacteria bacterium]HIA67060.1 hypothetical protein [Candidatus Poribacteria bacterium]